MKVDKNKPVKELTAGEFVDLMNESEKDLFPIEFITFTKQLKFMSDWFENYIENRKGLEDVMRSYYVEISNSIVKTAYNIGVLVSIEYNESLFHQEKGGVL